MIRRPPVWQLALLVVAALVVAARWALPETSGLHIEIFETRDWTGAPERRGLSSEVSIRAIEAASVRSVPDSFSARWSGYLVVAERGTYTFALTSDDGSRLTIGDTLVVDNGGSHAALTKTGEVALERRAYPISIDYAQEGGTAALELTWARDAGEQAELPSDVLSPIEIGPATVAWLAWLDRLFVPSLAGLGILVVWTLFPARLDG